MPSIKFSGPLRFRLKGFLALNKIAIATYLNHAASRKIHPDWDANMEIGVRFIRHQFKRAFNAKNINEGRQILDAVQTETPDIYDIDTRQHNDPKGTWYLPRKRKSNATILYLHGGGYTFHGAMSKRFAAMLAHHIGAPLFAPEYRLTPEHPHPAQAEDALSAWHHVAKDTPPKNIVIIGDSAGGHMVLMLLLPLREQVMSQPAACIALCPWTDIGDRGESLSANDKSDLVQGWMALQFGTWLDPDGTYGRKALSPIEHDYSGLAPLYLQAGGQEILRDMILQFAQQQVVNGADVICDLWPTMPHDFQLMDSTQEDSAEALVRITACVHSKVDGVGEFGKGLRSV
jgi:acetyl esterase/lipase